MTANGKGNSETAAAREHLQTLSLSAWDLERTRKERPDTPRSRIVGLRTLQRLLTALETQRNIPEEHRSVIKIQDSSKLACLLIHDWNGSPLELASLTDYLATRGLTVFSLLMSGHGQPEQGNPEVMWPACVQELRQRFRGLRRFNRRVSVVGVGYGAALAIHLAAKEPVSHLALLAPALVPRVSLIERILFRLGVHRLPFVKPRLGWTEEILTPMQRARALVPRLRIPIYAAQCDDDDRVSSISLRVLQNHARHGASRFRAFPTGGHAILEAHGKSTLNEEIFQFFKKP